MRLIGEDEEGARYGEKEGSRNIAGPVQRPWGRKKLKLFQALQFFPEPPPSLG